MANNSPKEAAEVAPDGAQSRDAEAARGAEAAQSAAAGLAEPARAALGAAAVAASRGAPAGSFARRELFPDCVITGLPKVYRFVYCGCASDAEGRVAAGDCRGADDARPFPMRSIEDSSRNAATTLEARWS